MKLSKKILSIVLSALMVFSMMPITAFAWDTGNLTFVKMDGSWDGYDGKYSAYVHNGTNNDFMGIVLKEVNSDGTITVNKGSSFDITLSCGTWTSSSASNGTLPNNTLSWHYGNNDTKYVISSVDSSGSGLTSWKAFLGDNTTTEIQSAIEGEFATAATPSDNFRARSSEGGTNEAYGVFKFTPTSFPQLNTVGEYTVRLAPTLVMNKWEGGLFSKKWEPKYGWGNYQWSIDQGSPDTNRTIAITVKVVCPHTNTEIRNKSDANCTTAGYTGDTYCTDCGAKTATGSTIPATSEHNYTVVKEARVEPTCTKVGKTAVMKCATCELTTGGDVIPATGTHSYTVLVSGKQEATCSATGKEAVYKCSTCELTTGGEEIAKLPHTNGTPVRENVVDSDCTNPGSYDEVVYCTVCNNEVSRTEKTIDALGHAWSEWVYQNDAKVNVDGTDKRTCSRCDAFETRTAVGTALPEVEIDVIDRNNEQTDTSSKVDVVIEKNAENKTVVKAEIKAEEAAKGTKFIGWYDESGNLVSSSPEYVVTDTSKPLTVKTADTANDGYSLGMNGQVDCHIYIDTLYYVDDIENTTIEISYNQNGTTYTQDVVTAIKTGAEVINNGDEFLFTTGYAPVQITEQISYKVYENGTLVYDSDVANANASIEKYCAAVINAGVYSTELTNLCQSVINYGSAAQNYFVGVTAPAVTATTTDVANLTTADVEAYKPTIQQTSASRADFQVTDMTFMSLENSAIRFYYTGSLDGYTVTVDGAKVTPQSKVVNGETYNYFEVSGIAAADLDALHDIRIVKDGKISFYAKASALSYVYLGVTGAPGALQNYKTFLATLFDYNVKNKEYKASKA